jgi:hypothetical protein
VVVAGTFPLEPTTDGYIRGRLAEEGLLADARISPLCVLDLDDVDYLEALCEAGGCLPDLLNGWKSSPLSGIAFRIYAHSSGLIPAAPSRHVSDGAERFRQNAPSWINLRS